MVTNRRKTSIQEPPTDQANNQSYTIKHRALYNQSITRHNRDSKAVKQELPDYKPSKEEIRGDIMPRPRLTMAKKKVIANKLLAQSNRVDTQTVANDTGVSRRTVGRVRRLIEAGSSLTAEEIANDVDLKKIYNKELAIYIDTMRKKVANITLQNAVKFLKEARKPEKVAKMSAAQAQLSGKIALDTALLATGQMPQGDAPSVKIYLPEASNKGWKIVKETPIDITEENKK